MTRLGSIVDGLKRYGDPVVRLAKSSLGGQAGEDTSSMGACTCGDCLKGGSVEDCPNCLRGAPQFWRFLDSFAALDFDSPIDGTPEIESQGRVILAHDTACTWVSDETEAPDEAGYFWTLDATAGKLAGDVSLVFKKETTGAGDVELHYFNVTPFRCLCLNLFEIERDLSSGLDLVRGLGDANCRVCLQPVHGGCAGSPAQGSTAIINCQTNYSLTIGFAGDPTNRTRTGPVAGSYSDGLWCAWGSQIVDDLDRSLFVLFVRNTQVGQDDLSYMEARLLDGPHVPQPGTMLSDALPPAATETLARWEFDFEADDDVECQTTLTLDPAFAGQGWPDLIQLATANL